MKKNYNPNDIHQVGQEQSKRLYRSISESARRLDDAYSCAHNVSDLFIPTLQIQRSKFQEYCERLIFFEPILFGRKTEELLWRKSYYDVISTAKKLKKKEYSPEDVCNIQNHINAGVGHYHHFISRLQHQFYCDVDCIVDFSILKQNWSKSNIGKSNSESLDWAEQSIHRCLIYLGDLNRYKLEIYPNWDSGLIVRYYLKAVSFKPEYGIPHNQMGTLASSQNRTLDAVYHYLCCLSCKHVFEGTENNLLRLFEKNSRNLEDLSIENGNADCPIHLGPSEHIKCLITRFIFLIETWYANKKNSDIYVICHQAITDLHECLLYSKPIIGKNEEISNDRDSIDTELSSSPTYMTDDVIFKIVVCCLLCITKLQKSQSSQLSTIIAFTLAIYSQLLQAATDHLFKSALNTTASYCEREIAKQANIKGIKSKYQKIKARRRRKKKKCSSEDESDFSDVEVVDEFDSNSDISINGSEDELVASSSDNESLEENTNKANETIIITNPPNQHTSSKITTKESDKCLSNNNNKSLVDSIHRIRMVNPVDMLEIITEEQLLCSIRILSEWLISNSEIVKSCGKNTRNIIRQIVHLLNFVNINISTSLLENDNFNIDNTLSQENILLPEDVALRGIEITSNIYYAADQVIEDKKLLPKEETLVRIRKLVAFGHSLTKIEEIDVLFDVDKRLFVINTFDEDDSDDTSNNLEFSISSSELVATENENTSTVGTNEIASNGNNGQLTKMKHMGQLWLAAEVRALENRIKGKASLSPYLVLDADCLTQYSSIVKHLVNSKKFIVIIPTAVVSALDDLKREKLEARDAIRWLELQLHQGNRFCRAQRPQEHMSLPLIKYPKKKDKAMFIYIHIIECCYYFAQQQKDTVNLVTLLLGNENALTNNENREMSYTGLARSVGVHLEYVVDFYEKWRKNSKGKK